jgi:hypothetical protein
MRRELRSVTGRAVYGRRKELVEPVFGVLKEQRGMRQFRLRGLTQVAVEFALGTPPEGQRFYTWSGRAPVPRGAKANVAGLSIV